MMRVNYELSKSPATYDYVNFLVRAEKLRLERGQDGISIRISFGRRLQSPRDKYFTDERKKWRINNLLIPLSRCLPSVVDVAVGEGLQTLEYMPPDGPQKPVLKAPEAARGIVRSYLEDKKNPVSITIRQSDFESQRNSDLGSWATVSKWLRSLGYTPIMVPDTEAEIQGKSALIGAEPYPTASLYPEIRLALYEQCVVNLMSAGGPMELALNADVPVMIWKLLVEGLPMNSEQNMARRGFIPMANWGPKRKIYLEPDDEKTVITKLSEELPNFTEERKAA